MPRINIDVDDAKYQELKNLMEASGIKTQKEFFNNAVSLTKWMMKQRKEGKAVGALTKDDKFTELGTPMLDNVSESDVEI